jgi:hypothetical protein
VIATALDPFDRLTMVGSSTRVSVMLVAPALSVACGALLAQLARDPVATGALVARGWIAFVFGFVAWVAVEMWAPALPRMPGLIALLATGGGVLIGLAAPVVARALGLPDPFLASAESALAEARDAIGATDLREVERGTLAALRKLAGAPSPRVEEADAAPAPRVRSVSRWRRRVCSRSLPCAR